MSKLLVIFGITGNQGRSAASTSLADPAQSKTYKDPRRGSRQQSARRPRLPRPRASSWSEPADLDNGAAAKEAVQGAYTVLAMAQTQYVDEVHTRGPAAPYDSKPAKRWVPHNPSAADGSFIIINIFSGPHKWVWIDIRESGTYLAPILSRPNKYAGKEYLAASEPRSFSDLAKSISDAMDKTVSYVAGARGEEYGNFGPGTQKKLHWAIEQTKGSLKTLEDFAEGERETGSLLDVFAELRGGNGPLGPHHTS
ncbi:hypothetical protein C8A03DRAFT_32529 [Achaetomium macrosporum]|uniref:NmrA-like domain-containing protein n=1 Tax=Achaetomium macrosporum TaxID=79813 RepID=A0AAN7CDQ5_9PEZI|nr:hypothetical protein C8A03DRAFT_32529 [Achaetomium macrosporum]